jgi:hypothetical protein
MAICCRATFDSAPRHRITLRHEWELTTRDYRTKLIYESAFILDLTTLALIKTIKRMDASLRAQNR